MDLILLRFKSFGYDILATATLAVVGFVASPQFATMVNQNFGESVVGVLVLLIAQGLVKHLRNLSVVRNRLGAKGKRPQLL